jgi:methionyl-tRNA synthetase
MVKIQEGNAASRTLFQTLGFKQQGEVNYFGEVMMAMIWDELKKQDWWEGAVGDYREVEYEGRAEEADTKA